MYRYPFGPAAKHRLSAQPSTCSYLVRYRFLFMYITSRQEKTQICVCAVCIICNYMRPTIESFQSTLIYYVVFSCFFFLSRGILFTHYHKTRVLNDAKCYYIINIRLRSLYLYDFIYIYAVRVYNIICLICIKK